MNHQLEQLIIQYILPVEKCIEQATHLHDQICYQYCGVCGEHIDEYKHDRAYIMNGSHYMQMFFKDSSSYHIHCIKRATQTVGIKAKYYKFARRNPNIITLEIEKKLKIIHTTINQIVKILSIFRNKSITQAIIRRKILMSHLK